MNEKMGISWRLLATSLIIAFPASFQCAYFSAIYNVPQDIMEQYVNGSIQDLWHRSLTRFELSTVWATIATMNQVGKVIACFLAPIMADQIGRKWTLLVSGALSVFGMLLHYIAQPTGMFLLLTAGRFVSGLHDGVVGVVVPLFLVEIAITSNWRGRVTRIHSVAAMMGITLAVLLGVPHILGTDDRWGYLALVPIPLALLGTCWLAMIPESPLHMLQMGKSEVEVRRCLQFYLGHHSTEAVESEFQSALKNQPKIGDGTTDWRCLLQEHWSDRQLRKKLILWFMLSIGTGFSGGSILKNYLTSMIAQASTYSIFDKYAAVITNAVKIVIVLTALFTINKVGRKALLLTSMWLVAACFFALATIGFTEVYRLFDRNASNWMHVVFLFIWTCIVHIIQFTATLIVSETADQRSRALALGIYEVTTHLIDAFLTLLFPPIAICSEGGSYLFFAIPFLFICVYISVVCPETKGMNMFTDGYTEKSPLIKSQLGLNGAAKRRSKLLALGELGRISEEQMGK